MNPCPKIKCYYASGLQMYHLGYTTSPGELEQVIGSSSAFMQKHFPELHCWLCLNAKDPLDWVLCIERDRLLLHLREALNTAFKQAWNSAIE